MQFAIEQKELMTALTQVLKLVPSRPTHPILAGILVEAKGDTVTLTGFNLSNGIKIQLPADVIIPGSAVFPGKLFADAVSKLPKGELNIVNNQASLKVAGERAEINLNSMDASEYPELPLTQENTLNFEEGKLPTAIGRVLFAVSGDETKQVLTGINFRTKDERLVIAGTNGHVLARYETEAGELDLPSGLTVPAGVLSVLNSLKIKGDIQVSFDDTLVSFYAGSVTLVGRVLQGHYPMVDQLIPATYEHTVTFNRKALINAAQSVSFLDQKEHLIILKFNTLICTISGKANDIGSAKFEIDCDYDNGGQEYQIMFNASYLISGLSTFEEETIKLNMNAPNTPATVTDETTTFLLMPVQTVK
mgnify:CR=1 FL=1